MRISLIIVLSVLFLVGCPDPPAKSAPKTGAAKTGVTKTASKTGAPAKTSGGAAEGLKPLPKSDDPKVGIQANSIDPVCKMEVSITNPGATVNFGDTAYIFCSEQCAKTFKANPKQYLRQE